MELFTIKEASSWATNRFGRNITPSNIAYLIQYGRIQKKGTNSETLIGKEDLARYYESHSWREIEWTQKLGNDLNWHLSFENIRESERTKHVHRLHPYKGKFIPQLVEYFLDDHIDEFKKEIYFRKGDVLLDPFGGSGTTLVQANEMGMHAVGVDISQFNALISNVKIKKHDLVVLHNEIRNITISLKEFTANSNIFEFDNELTKELAIFNNDNFPSPVYKIKVYNKEINEREYTKLKAEEFLRIFWSLVYKYGIQIKQIDDSSFLSKWYLRPIRREMDFTASLIDNVEDSDIKNILMVILSRTIRSCRATTHSDLATLVDPVSTTYYCNKHYKICKPIFSILNWWVRYSQDTIKRLAQFDKLRTNTEQICLRGDSRYIDIFTELEISNPKLAYLAKSKGIKGIFSSPPYVGLIDYHDQHSYAYDLFRFKRNGEQEIGKMSLGQGAKARNMYIEAISTSLINCSKYLTEDYNVFLVANDKYNLYPTIAKKSGMRIVDQYKRPVLARTERDKGAYSEIIFHLKKGE